MMDLATAAQELREARLALGLSQGHVARDTGVNRSQLSLFEARKYLLDRAKLETLRRYYSSRGYRFDEAKRHLPILNPTAPAHSASAASVDQSDVDLLDGFVVAGGIDRTRAEAWLNQIAANDTIIQDLFVTPTTTDFWTGDPKTDDRDEALLQMARNYALVRRLHGKEILPALRPAKDKVSLTGDLVRELYWGKSPSETANQVAKSTSSKHAKRKVKR
jgi:transcriptional regulator with XRE-family HTH domain